MFDENARVIYIICIIYSISIGIENSSFHKTHTPQTYRRFAVFGCLFFVSTVLLLVLGF